MLCGNGDGNVGELDCVLICARDGAQQRQWINGNDAILEEVQR